MRGVGAMLRCAAMASVIALVAPALAQEGPPAKVYIEFEGGLTGKDMANVIDAFGPPADIMPTRIVLPEQPRGICWVLNAELKMPADACTEDLIRAVVTLSRRSGITVNPAVVSSARGVVLPDIAATTTDVKRIYNLSENSEAERLDQILKNPGWANVIEKKDENLLQPFGNPDLPRLDQLTLKRISWEFSVSDPSKIAEAALIARRLSTKNLIIDVERGKGFDKKAHMPAQSAATVFENARLWPDSNRDANQAKRRFVSVMAPGGGEIPTYVSDKAINKVTGGTSAAAAFTAGLAARMFQCHPSSYRGRPARLKERIILASRPVKNKAVVNDLAGGVIDPQVSMLDPGKTWLKRKTGPVRPVTFHRWCNTLLKLKADDDGSRDPLLLTKARRLTRADNIGLVYQRVDEISNETYVKRTVRREAPAMPVTEEKIAVVQYEDGTPECAVMSSDLTDLFLDKDNEAEGDCSAVPVCH